MNVKKAASVYAIFMGLCMIGMWVMFYLSGSIPELETKPVEIAMHLIAEFTTAALLILGGYGLLKDQPWGMNIYCISMGMLLYTLMMSPGYFLQKGELSFGIMFGAFFITAVLLTYLLLKQKNKQVQCIEEELKK
ncbi:hypothetical protein SAMN02745975_02809 [Geosporobacter subterraneus DSM 17957]|uniref:DUF8058 domain-containing protein n=1 Tax=Geosporobacter subterraneus DSM 17957 TaxID=1121919 RepID=A0A1M6LYC4_9FIRM|nr:hypothetical protein [Geosporobacter subterraneus]SHJ76160.1 hypothetical protein SAMN02745975_02809 [Geosporobacter subterraneus DSM 17957]